MRVAITVKYCPNTGDTSLVLESASFAQESALMRADVLNDCCGMLTVLYNKTLYQWREEIAAHKKSKKSMEAK